MKSSLLGGDSPSSSSEAPLLGGGGMANDRFAELQGLGAMAGGPDVETGPGYMGDFFHEVAQIKQEMESMRGNVAELVQNHAKALTDVYAGAQYKERIEDLTDETNALATRVRNKLTSLDQDLKAMLQRDSSAAQQSDYKIRRNMHATLTKKFMEQMQDYQEAQAKYKRNVEETVKRQFKIVKPDASEAEVAEVLENGGQGIFTENMLASQNARSALEDVQEKHKDIQRLESSIQELHQLFVDLSVLVESQGELLNDIEHNVETSVEYMKSGVGELVKANEYAAKSRKKMCCLIMFFVIVAAVTIGPHLLSSS